MMKNAISHNDSAHPQQIQATLIRRKDVERITGLSRSAIYARLDVNSGQYDPTFPKPITLGVMSVAWIAHEVYEWVDSIIAKSRAPIEANVTNGICRKDKINNKRKARELIVNGSKIDEVRE